MAKRRAKHDRHKPSPLPARAPLSLLLAVLLPDYSLITLVKQNVLLIDLDWLICTLFAGWPARVQSRVCGQRGEKTVGETTGDIIPDREYHTSKANVLYYYCMVNDNYSGRLLGSMLSSTEENIAHAEGGEGGKQEGTCRRGGGQLYASPTVLSQPYLYL